MLLLEFLDGKGVFVLQQVLANLRFSVSVFFNFANLERYDLQLLQKFCCSCVSLTSLIWMKDRENIMKGNNQLWTQSAIVVC